MEKALFYIIAGENERSRAVMGLMVARRAHEFKRFDDVKVILQGPSEKLVYDETPEIRSVVDYLITNRIIDSACSNFAQRESIAEPIVNRGVELKPSGERLASFVNSGYVPISF